MAHGKCVVSAYDSEGLTSCSPAGRLTQAGLRKPTASEVAVFIVTFTTEEIHKILGHISLRRLASQERFVVFGLAVSVSTKDIL
ncbi:hypothetical protein BDQ94DRAFT_150868 [Aspergillus welwitschiae]|uniref:Uncharacterized protein n=1 Tax=Aspergillus welwitschiae TaxID=1341132 RepID=A0A3F3PR96_9EURO|nr:hypothetical protein BDQ94DRAFT_150868 [Aspergillus welwitschiae]RDH29262.1 hypothetical protein BDQ94DRAFT_150868 [Aspergillus welwitschiae]